jgi:hypothetical protein
VTRPYDSAEIGAEQRTRAVAIAVRVNDIDAMSPNGVSELTDQARSQAAAKGDGLHNDPDGLRPLEGAAVRRCGEHDMVPVARLPSHRVQGAILETA